MAQAYKLPHKNTTKTRNAVVRSYLVFVGISCIFLSFQPLGLAWVEYMPITVLPLCPKNSMSKKKKRTRVQQNKILISIATFSVDIFIAEEVLTCFYGWPKNQRQLFSNQNFTRKKYGLCLYCSPLTIINNIRLYSALLFDERQPVNGTLTIKQIWHAIGLTQAASKIQASLYNFSI